jgi:glycosyltransferase involved in cell wall biosynthesis
MPERSAMTSADDRRPRVVMLLENQPYPQDVRVRLEALALTADGYDVTVIAPRGSGQRRRETVDGVTVQRFGLPTAPASPAAAVAAGAIVFEYVIANAQLYLRGLAALIAGADIVHLNNPPDTLFGVAYAARALRRRVVYDMHDVAPELFAAKFGDERVVRVLRWLERRSARSADRLLTVNESLCELASQRDAVPRERITLVRNAPPSAMLAEATPARDGSLADPRLVFVGNIESQDGVEILPELVRVLRDERGLSGVRLTIVGDGAGRGEVEARCRESGVQDSVELTGRVPHERIAGILAQADICLEPAPCNPLNHLCSMVKVYEYMSAGRPIVGYPLREVTRLAGDGMLYAEGGGPAALADQIVRLADDPELRRTLGARVRRRAHELTWERSAEALLAAYASITPSRRPL